MKNSDIFWALYDMDDDLIREAKEAPMMKTNNVHPVRIMLIAAAVVVLLAGTALAISELWAPKLAALFGADEKQQELLDVGFVQNIGVSDSDNGVTITAEQLIGDANGVYILYSIKADDPKLLSAWTFPHYKLTLDGESRGKGCRDWADPGNLHDVEQRRDADGTLYFYDLLMTDPGESFSGKQAYVHVDYIDDMATDQDIFPVIWEGDIELSWEINYVPSEVRTYEIHQNVVWNDSTIQIESANISSIGITLTCSGIPTVTNDVEGLGNVVSIRDEYREIAGALSSPVSITLSNGTICEMDRNHLGGTKRYDDNGDVEFVTLFAGQIFREEAYPVSLCYELDGETFTVELK